LDGKLFNAVIRNKACFIGILALILTCTTVCWAQSVQYYRVKSDVIEERLRRYEGKDAERRVTLTRLFEEVGCKDNHLEVQPVKNADAPNVICTLPGSTDKVIVVGAHFDRVDKGHGVVDNWSGASMLPSLYQSLNIKTPKHTYIFIGFSDEEEGYVGSGFYVDSLTDEELDSIQAMVNLDTLGLDTTKVWASNSDPFLVALVFNIASKMDLPVNIMNVDNYGDSDGSSFKKRDVRVLTMHSITVENIGILHSNKDTFSAIELDDYYDSYNLIAAFLAVLDEWDGDGPR